MKVHTAWISVVILTSIPPFGDILLELLGTHVCSHDPKQFSSASQHGHVTPNPNSRFRNRWKSTGPSTDLQEMSLVSRTDRSCSFMGFQSVGGVILSTHHCSAGARFPVDWGRRRSTVTAIPCCPCVKTNCQLVEWSGLFEVNIYWRLADSVGVV